MVTMDALVWAEPEQAPFLRAACDAAALRIAAVATAAVGRTPDLAAAIGAQPVPDFRAALARFASGLVLLGSGAGFDGPDEIDALLACAERGVRVCTLDPMPASVLNLPVGPAAIGEDDAAGVALGPGPAETDTIQGDEIAVFLPRARLSAPMRSAADIISQLGPIRMVSVHALSGPGHGALGARVYDAMELVVWLMGQPERVDAARVAAPSLRAAGVQALPGDSLRSISGDLSANLRFADGRAASIVASDRAGRWSRTITLVGERGRVRVFDDGLEWIGEDGRVVDATRDAARVRGSAASESPDAAAVRVLAEQLRRIAAREDEHDAPPSVAAILAAAGAALLSARTGEGERPGTILRMSGGQR